MRPLIYLSTFYPQEKRDYIISGMHSAANISASAFSYSILAGLTKKAKDRVYVINTPLTGPYPMDYKRFYTPPIYTEDCGVKVKSVGSYNMYGIQGSSISGNIFRAMKTLDLGASDILIYSIQLPILQAAIKYKKENIGSKIILVVPDLLEDLNKRSSFVQKVKSILFGDFNELCNEVDGYVLLTEQMLERMPFERPYCVVEGIYNPSEKRNMPHASNGDFVILYSGMLYEKFGVKNLVDAFCSLDLPGIRLQLCGNGDLEEYIRKLSAKDLRIEFLGIVPRDRVLQLQSNASLLVNPRQPNGGYTRYSFPSKNIEYLASGTPALIYELEGIPQDYYRYCYHLPATKKSVDDLAAMITDIFNKSEKERIELAASAQSFIFCKKNALFQCDRIISFIDNI